jgi:hypothetical protein
MEETQLNKEHYKEEREIKKQRKPRSREMI